MPSRPWSIEGGKGIIGSIVQSGQPELVNDAEADPRGVQIPGTARQQDERLMVVPLVADGAVEGAMAVWRTGGQPFDDRDLQFLVGLSRQAMVALRNARLFDETKEALERQTATAEILQVISGSPTDVQPVFDAIVERSAPFAAVDVRRRAAPRREWLSSAPRVAHRDEHSAGGGLRRSSVAGAHRRRRRISRRACFLGKAVVHLPDWTADRLPQYERTVFERHGRSTRR